MSRAINVKATEAEVMTMCAKHGAVVTSIETLRSGGTRVVLTNGDSAAVMRRAYGSKVIEGAVHRQPTRVAHWDSIAPPAATPASSRHAAGSSFPWKPTRDR